MEVKEIIYKAVNTGQISFLKLKGYKYTTGTTINNQGKEIIEYYFDIPIEDVEIPDKYWNSEFSINISKFKRELDATRQEIESKKKNFSVDKV